MKFKEAIQRASVDIALARMEAAPKVQEIATRKWVRVASRVIIIGLLFCMMAVPAFATEGAADIFVKGEALATEVTDQIKDISAVLAILCLVVCGLLYMFAGNSRSVDTAKSWIVRILVALALIMASPLIIDTVKRLTTST